MTLLASNKQYIEIESVRMNSATVAALGAAFGGNVNYLLDKVWSFNSYVSQSSPVTITKVGMAFALVAGPVVNIGGADYQQTYIIFDGQTKTMVFTKDALGGTINVTASISSGVLTLTPAATIARMTVFSL